MNLHERCNILCCLYVLYTMAETTEATEITTCQQQAVVEHAVTLLA